MSERVDYQRLYESEKKTTERLLEENEELKEEMEKYKSRYLRKCSYAEEQQLVMEEAEKQKNKREKTKIKTQPSLG